MSCATREQAEKGFRLAFSEAVAESDHLFCEIVDECADISNNGLANSSERWRRRRGPKSSSK
jgi:hypothetical protein